MSHYTVTVRVPAKRLAEADGDIEAAVGKMLEPFEESVRRPDNSPYFVFESSEDEYRKEYETEGSNMVKCPDGEVVYPWDDRFRKPGSFGIGSDTHAVPEGQGYEEIRVPHRERFTTFEKFVADYHGEKRRDEKHNVYGHYRNPNAKWDWWTIGGRWRGYFPVKLGVKSIIGPAGSGGNAPSPGRRSDVVRRDQIDLDEVARIERERFDTFKNEYRRVLAGEKLDPFEGPRGEMLDMGLLRVEEDPDAPIGADELAGKTWGEENPHFATETGPRARGGWRDVSKFLTDEQLERYRCKFNPLKTFAALVEGPDGTPTWIAPGRMGWFGAHDDTPDQYLAYCDAYLERVIKSA